MTKPGLKNIAIGGLILAAGIGITWWSYSNAEAGESYSLFWGAIAIGAVQLLIGLFQYITFSLKSPAAKQKHYAQADLEKTRTLALMSMIYQSLSDKSLNDQEVEVIRAAFGRHLGGDLDKKEIRQLAKRVSRADFDAEVHQLAESVSPEGRLTALRLSYLVAIADAEDDIDPDEKARLAEIASSLGLPKDAVAEVIDQLGPDKQ